MLVTVSEPTNSNHSTINSGINMTSNNIYTILSSKPHNIHYLNRYIKFIDGCRLKNSSYSEYTEEHHICPKAKDLFPEYKSFRDFPYNKIRLTTHQHIIAHIILWKVYGGSQAQALDYFVNKQNSKTNSTSKRFIPTSIFIRYAARIREESRIMSLGMATYKDSNGTKYYLHKDDSTIQELNLVGNNAGLTMTDESKELMARSKDHCRTIKLYLLDQIISVKLLSDEYTELLNQGWHNPKSPEDYEYIRLQGNGKQSTKMKGKFTYYYPDGITKYGYISTSDPVIQELGLIVPYTENKQKQNVKRSKLAAEVNTGSSFYNNGSIMKKFKKDPGGEWIKGQLQRDRSAQTDASSKQRKDTVVYNDGITNFYIPKGDEPNPLWIKGMKPRVKQLL